MTINEQQQEIIKEMSGQKDWLDKYEYLNKLGRNLPRLSDDLKTEEHLLPGCQSRVWIVPEYDNDRLKFKAESDSSIIQGILALLLKVLNNQSPEDIAGTDLFFISETGLSRSLSPSRTNGVATIVKELKRYANIFLNKRKPAA